MGRKTSGRAGSARGTGGRRPAQLVVRDVPESGPVFGAPRVTPVPGAETAVEPAGDATSSREEDPRSVGDPRASQTPDHDQFEDDVPQGVEYNVVLTAPPSEIIPFLAKVVSISRGREDLPMSDEDWKSLLIEDDED